MLTKRTLRDTEKKRADKYSLAQLDVLAFCGKKDEPPSVEL
jgi:hypothetical protein